MTVAELIEELRELPEDAIVLVASESDHKHYSTEFWVRIEYSPTHVFPWIFLEVIDD